jgi:hypothetical protein
LSRRRNALPRGTASMEEAAWIARQNTFFRPRRRVTFSCNS